MEIEGELMKSSSTHFGVHGRGRQRERGCRVVSNDECSCCSAMRFMAMLTKVTELTKMTDTGVVKSRAESCACEVTGEWRQNGLPVDVDGGGGEVHSGQSHEVEGGAFGEPLN